jgi:sorbitol-specific phosphotransferase system component IIBC
MKRTAIATLAAALAGSILATLIAPRAIIWYFTPPAGMAMTFDAAATVQYGISRLIRAQLLGAAFGAVIAWIISFLLYRRRSKAAAATPASAPATPVAK